MYLIQIYTQTNKINQTTKKAIDQNKICQKKRDYA
jgi:hypothetical protein